MQAQQKRTSMVYLEHSERLSFDEKRLPNAQILLGNVCFRHDSVLMYCDSAYFFEKENSLHAFGNVHLIQGDSLEGFGDILYYYGDSKLAKFRKHVRLLHKGTTLSTNNLNYDRIEDIAYYFSGGTIKDSINTLTSTQGQYTPYNNQALFRENVKLVHPNFTLTSDTLCYNTTTHQADIVSPTRIQYEQETTINSSKGWYNTKTEQSMLLDRSTIVHNDGIMLTGDTIYYDKIVGYGQVKGNMQSIDSIHQMTLYGNTGEIWESDDLAYATDSAMLVEWSDSNMYTYVHADTLFTKKIPYRTYHLILHDSVALDSTLSTSSPDTSWVDTSYMQVRAYRNVRLYREDIQLVCDSLHYEGKDSTAILCGDPVCWNQSNQVSADTITAHFKNNVLDYLHGLGNAIAIKREGDNEYNQMAGKEMYAYVKKNDIHLVDVAGNAETIFYPREENGNFIGVNKILSSFVKVYLENRVIHHIVFTTTTTGVLIPLEQATHEDKFLATFFWAEQERPRQPGDIFLRPQRTPRPNAQTISAAEQEDEEEEENGNRKNRSKRRNK